MESVIFEGKEFVKASVLAKRFNYTPDYLGQLCRGKKVDARLVGRSWYINLESLNEHKGSRYKTDSLKATKNQILPPEPALKKPEPHYLSRVDVEPILKGKTVRLLKETKNGLKDVAVRYEADDNVLIPRVARDVIRKELNIDIDGSESLKVSKGETRSSIFKPEPIPEVYLRGRISVEGLPEAIDEVRPADVKNVENTSHIVSSATSPNPVTIEKVRFKEKTVQSVLVRRTLKRSVKPVASQDVKKASSVAQSGPKSLSSRGSAIQVTEVAPGHQNIARKADFTPVSVKNTVKTKTVRKGVRGRFVYSGWLLFMGVVLFVAFFVKNDVSVEDGFINSTYKVEFNKEIFSEIFALFSR